MIACCVWVRAWSGVCIFCCENHALAMSFEKLAEKGLARAIRVDVCGINEVAAQFSKGIIDFFRLVFAGAPAPVFAERHGAEAEFRNTQSRFSKQSVIHNSLLIFSIDIAIDRKRRGSARTPRRKRVEIAVMFWSAPVLQRLSLAFESIAAYDKYVALRF